MVSSPIPYAIELSGISKYFGNFCANREVNFKVAKGEIHALLGENGAGKSTLMHILSGWYRADSGEIKLHGKPVVFRSPVDALFHRVGMVHQRFKLVDRLTVFENIILGQGKILSRKRGFWKTISRRFFTANFQKQTLERINAISSSYGLDIDPFAYVHQLTIGERQCVEIMKVLYFDTDVLILDEPTSVLTPQQTKLFFRTLQKLRDGGCTIVFITHKLKEVLDYTENVSIMCKGRMVGVHKVQDVDERTLASLMVGEDFLPLETPHEKSKRKPILLRVDKIGCMGKKKEKVLQNVSFDVGVGEIVGVAGITGNGQEELAECLTGLRKVISGSIHFSNKPIENLSPREIIDRKIGYVPADRLGWGVAPDFSIEENLILKSYQRMPFFLSRSHIEKEAERQIRRFKIKCRSPKSPAKFLSGGNLQKLILARELSADSLFIIAVYPTRGLDIAASKFVQENFLALKKIGKSILYISEDLDDIFLMSDRIVVLSQGKVVDVVAAEKSDKTKIGLMMMGKAK